MYSELLVIMLLALAWAACIVVTGRLFRASGRAAFAGRLVGFLFTWVGVVIGLILLAKGPPKPPKPWLGWGGMPPPGGWRDAPPGFWRSQRPPGG